MFIQAIDSFVQNKYTRNNTSKKQAISFTAHPDFERLAMSYNITASSFFRRGPFYGAPTEGFKSIIELFSKLFNRELKSPLNMLIVGVGKSQEPFSYLAVIKNLIGDKKISEVLNLQAMDLQSKPKKSEIFNNSYYEFPLEPTYVPSSFVYDKRENVFYGSVPGYYRVNSEIFKYLNLTYNDKTRSFWDTRVQEGINKIKDDSLDIVSINNTIGYIEENNERVETVQNIYRKLKKGGVLISDYHYDHVNHANLQDQFISIEPGIYQKK